LVVCLPAIDLFNSLAKRGQILVEPVGSVPMRLKRFDNYPLAGHFPPRSVPATAEQVYLVELPLLTSQTSAADTKQRSIRSRDALDFIPDRLDAAGGRNSPGYCGDCRDKT
jgi:hypothetical protein